MGTNLHVGNLPASATADDLLAKFRQFGTVESAEIIKGKRTGDSRSAGLVRMASDLEARAAINRLNFSQYGDLTITVSVVKEEDAA